MNINAGGNLQAALDAAVPGDVLELEAGATFLGNFALPLKPAGPPITVRGAATIRTPNSAPALRTISNTRGWRFEDVTFACGASQDAIVRLGDSVINTEAGLPRDITFERCTFVADTSAKNGLEMNAINVTLRACTVRGVKLAGIESHAIIIYNSPGPFLVEDCTLEAGSCGFFVGGVQAAIPGCVPSDIIFRRNLTTRPLAMKTQTGWGVKNLFELKNARRVQVYGNVFEHNWPDGQHGYAIVLTVRANSLTAPWTTIEDVLFEHNIVRHTAMAFNVLGLDNQVISGQVCPSQRMDRVTVRNNLIYDMDRLAWPPVGSAGLGSGTFMQIGGAPRNLVVEDNTVHGLVTGNILAMSGDPMTGFVFRRNLVQKVMTPYQTYGIFGDAQGEGNAAIARYCPDAVIANNALAGCTTSVYSSRPLNLFPAVAALLADYVDPTTGNYRLKPTSLFLGCGCNQDALEAAQRPPCVYTVSPQAISFTHNAAGSQGVWVTRSAATCPVDATDLPGWLRYDVIDGIIFLDAAHNLDPVPRSATILVAGQPVTVTQEAAPPPEPTLLEIINAIAQAQLALCDGVGGDVSPQQAARDAVARCLETVLEALGTPA